MLEQILKELLEMVETANYKSNKIVELMKEIEEKDVIITEHDAVKIGRASCRERV